MKEIKVLLVDDHSVVRKGLRMFLEVHPQLCICGEAGTISEAIEKADVLRPDVVLLDFKLPDGDGVNACIALKMRHPKLKVIILTAYTQHEMVVGAIRAGVDAYLLKDVDSNALIDTILAVFQGKSVLDASATHAVFNSLKGHKDKNLLKSTLSPQEVRIMDLIALGKVNKEIGDALGISEKTVRNYISNIFKKMNVSNRTEAATLWVRKTLDD